MNSTINHAYSQHFPPLQAATAPQPANQLEVGHGKQDRIRPLTWLDAIGARQQLPVKVKMGEAIA